MTQVCLALKWQQVSCRPAGRRQGIHARLRRLSGCSHHWLASCQWCGGAICVRPSEQQPSHCTRDVPAGACRRSSPAVPALCTCTRVERIWWLAAQCMRTRGSGSEARGGTHGAALMELHMGWHSGWHSWSCSSRLRRLHSTVQCVELASG